MGSISGRVLSPSGTFGVFDAEVSVEITINGQPTRRQTHSRFDGTFGLYSIPAGTYTLHATRGIYAGDSVPITVGNNERVTGTEVRILSTGIHFEVVTGSFDDIGAIVDGLGFTHVEVDGTFDSSWLTNVTDADTLNASHAILINCGVDDEIWGITDLEARRQALRSYVHSGKSIYISDWAYDVMEWLFPEALGFYGEDVEHNSAQRGQEEVVLADVPDETLSKLVGETINITYDLPYWAILRSVDAPVDGEVTVDVIARATVHARGGVPVEDVPLAVIVHYGAGRVIYTTFHNEAQLDATVASILQYMVMSL